MAAESLAVLLEKYWWLLQTVHIWQKLCENVVQINLLKSFFTQKERITVDTLIFNRCFSLFVENWMNVMRGYSYCGVLKSA